MTARVGFDPLIDLIRNYTRFAIATHINPDGDAVGSCVALAALLRGMNCSARIINTDPRPSRYDFIDLENLFGVFDDADPPRRDELVCILDASQLPRLGRTGRYLAEHPHPIICLDHHADVDYRGAAAVIDATAAATSVLVFRLAQRMGQPLSRTIATAIYAGVMTDTGCFRYANTNPEAFAVAMRCVACGARPEVLATAMYEENPRGRVELFQRLLAAAEFVIDGRVALVMAPLAWLSETNTAPEDLEGVVEYLRGIAGVEVALLLRQLPDGRTKASVRSAGATPLDVAGLCRRWQGGGHRVAAGATLTMSMPEARAALLAALAQEV